MSQPILQEDDMGARLNEPGRARTPGIDLLARSQPVCSEVCLYVRVWVCVCASNAKPCLFSLRGFKYVRLLVMSKLPSYYQRLLVIKLG